MKQEIEVKILDIDLQRIREKLRFLGATRSFQGTVKTLFFDFPDQRLEKEGRLLRLRKLGNRSELCWKGKKEKKQFKIREEIETGVDDFSTTLQILQNLGLEKIKEKEKFRESYQLGEAKVEIDSWEGISPFLEVEAPTEEKVKVLVEKLGFSMQQTTTLSAAEIEEKYNKMKV